MLPEIKDGVFRIDNSGMECILKCHTYALYKLAHRRIPAFTDPEQNFGRGIHAAMEWRYKKCGAKALTDEQKTAQAEFMERWFAKNPMPSVDEDEAWQTPARAREAVGYYNEKYQDEPFEVVATEQSVEAELGSVPCPDPEHSDFGRLGLCPICGTRWSRTVATIKVMWQGKLDSLVLYNGKLMVRDFKTSKYDFDAKAELKFRLSGQFRGYCFLASTLNHGPVRDYWIDSIVMRKPLARETAKSKPRNEFDRAQFSVTDAEIEEWRADTLRQIEVWLQECARGAVTRNRTQCSWPKRCGFAEVCELRGEQQRLAWLESGAYRDNDWDPMKTEESID